MPWTRCQPRKMSLAACISRWPTTTRSPSFLGAYRCRIAGGHVRLSTERLGLLDLQEQRVAVVPAAQQHDPAAGPDAADPDHLAGHVDELELVEQGPPVARQRAAVVVQQAPDPVSSVLARSASGSRSAIGTISGGSALIRTSPVDDLGELGEGLEAVAGPGLRHGLVHGLAAARAQARPAQRPVTSSMSAPRVPDVERAHAGELGHGVAVAPDRLPSTLRRRSLRENPLTRPATDRLAASRLTSHSHGPGDGLVEVVEVEEQPAFGRGEQPEVRQVRVTAQLHRRPETGAAARSIGHPAGVAAEERERGRHHPAVPHRHQLGNAGARLLLGQRRPGPDGPRAAPARPARPAAAPPAPRVLGRPARAGSGGGPFAGFCCPTASVAARAR